MATIAEELKAAAVTDSLLRNENPLSNEGKWNRPSWDQSIGQCGASFGWDTPTPFSTNPDGARWVAEKLKAEGATHVFAILQLSRYSSTQLAERWFGTWVCMHETAQSGYRAKAEYVSGTGGGTYNFKLEKLVSGTPTVIGEAQATMPVGGKLAIVVGQGKVYLYKQDEEAAEFTQVVEVEDATYAEGFSGMEARGNFFEGKNFATGTFSLGGAAAPEVQAGVASSITHVSAVLNGTVDPNLASTDYYFEYGPTESYGTKVPVTEDGDAGEGDEPVAVDETIEGLEPETLYHFRLVAVNPEGEDVGADATFTTDAAPEAPTATTDAATNVTHSTARLNATIDPGNTETDYYFEYGETEAYGTKIPVTEDGDAGAGGSPVAVFEDITGLSPSTLYHFRVVAVNGQGEDVGLDATFETSAEPAGKKVTVRLPNGSTAEAFRWIKLPNGELVSV